MMTANDEIHTSPTENVTRRYVTYNDCATLRIAS